MEFHPLAEQAAKEAAAKESATKSATDSKEQTSAAVSSSANSNSMMAQSNTTVPPPPESFFTTSPPCAKTRVDQVSKFLSADELAAFDRDGFLYLSAKRVWSDSELSAMISSVNAMDNWADAPGKWMKYYEKDRTDAQGNKLLQRIENFCQFNSELDSILRGKKLLGMCSDLFNEESILYKEKVNYKLPGGDGFAPHQDVAAGWWMYNQSVHISVLISVDASHKGNGALECVRGAHKRGILGAAWKEVPAKLVEEFKWEMIETSPGDVVFFDSFVPHRSAPNNSSSKRRVLYSTYAKASEGDYRDLYYADKRKSFPPDCEREQGKKYEYKI